MKQLRLLVSVFCAFSCLVLPPQGKPSVAVPLAVPEWVNAAGQSYNGTNANVSQNSGSSAHSSLQLDSSGNPCVAWTDYTPGNSDIFFARWSGSSWVNASGATLTATNGNVSNNLRDSYYPSLALDLSGNPCIAWEDDTPGNGNDEIYFARWNGSSWVNASGATLTATNGNVSNNSGWSVDPSLALDLSGNPCIAWTDYALGNHEIYFARWNGSSWVNASGATLTATNGNVSNNSGTSWYPSLALDSNSNPCLAWEDDTLGNNWEIFFARWSGSSWVNASGATLTATNGNVSNNSGNSWYPSLALDSSSNPCIAWEDTTPGNPDIFFARWSGSSWVNASGATLTATNGNVSNNLRDSYYPSLALDSSSNPCIAWENIIPGSREIYFARWNGSSWVNAPGTTLTATNGNVSNNSGNSYDPSLALDSSGNPCIAWDDTSYNWETFFVRWSSTQQGPRLPVRSFIKEVDTDGDGIFDDKLKPVSEGQILRYKLTIEFDKKGISGEISDIIPENTEYVGMENGYKPPSSTYSDGKEWAMISINDEPNNKYAKRNGAYLRWKVNSDEGLVQTFVYKVKTLTQGTALFYSRSSLAQKQSTQNAYSLQGYVVNSFEALFNNQDGTCSYTNVVANPSTNNRNLTIKEPIEGQYWTMGCGMNVRWDVPADIKNSDLLGVNVYAIDSNGNKIEVYFNHAIRVSDSLVNIVIDRNKWCDSDLFKNCNPGDAIKGYIEIHYLTADSKGTYKTKNTTFINLMLTKWPVLNYARWADPYAAYDNGERWPLIFINGINPFGRGNETLLWDDLLIFLKNSPEDLNNKLRSFKPYIFSFDSHQPYTDIEFQRISNVGKELKREIKRSGLFFKNRGLYIVAHSMGGLIARSFMREKLDIVPETYCGDYVTRLITLATPHHGSNLFAQLSGPFSKYVNDMQPDNYESNYINCTNPFLHDLNDPIDKKLIFRDKLVVLGANKDEVVDFKSALFVKDILEPIISLANRYTDNIDDVEGSILLASITGLNFNNSAHISLCRSPKAMQEVKNSLHAPIILVNCYTEPGKAVIEVNGKAFGNWQGKTKLPINLMFENIPITGQIIWSDEKVITTLMPRFESINSEQMNIYLNKITSNQTIKNVIVNIIIEGNGKPSSISEDTPNVNIASIEEDIYYNKSSVSLSIWPSKSQFVKGENVEFTIKARNTGTSELINVNIINNVPRELEFISSTIKGVMSKNKLRITLSTLKPNEAVMFKVLCRLANEIYIPEESGLWLLYTANLLSGNNISTATSALVRYLTIKPSDSLSMNVTWKGLNTKTNVVNLGTTLSLEIRPTGGSSPYTINVEWGDGERSHGMLEQKDAAVFDHPYKSKGEYEIVITCSDSFGRSARSSRRIRVE